jgi:squalene-hopene/tetraprenyl-beta-curcumene cyclase
MKHHRSPLFILTAALCATPSIFHAAPAKLQYNHQDIRIPAATADEPLAKALSIEKASAYLDAAAKAWAGQRSCVSCHTTGAYLRYRPALTARLGKPDSEMRGFFIAELNKLKAADRSKFNSGTRTAQAVYIAAGLAEWDKHVTKKLSGETVEALRFMVELQQENGAWQSLDCWPPYESSAYQEATVAVMAAASAPGWLQSDLDPRSRNGVRRAKEYLVHTAPPHDYARVLKLWAATQLPSLVQPDEGAGLIKMIWEHQNDDGGWSIRSFALPEEWGNGNRAGKLRKEPEFRSPPSDGHMTGLAVLVLRETGVPKDDPRLRKAVKWIKSNQRESGRWWTRSLNTDKFHFITYSGTAYSLLALEKCGEL